LSSSLPLRLEEGQDGVEERDVEIVLAIFTVANSTLSLLLAKRRGRKETFYFKTTDCINNKN